MDTRQTRPPKQSRVAKRSQFATRIRLPLREKLEAAALENGRSVSEETEFRLEQSFLLERALSIPETVRMTAVFAIVGQHAAEYEGHSEWVSSGAWRRDAVCYEAAALAVVKDLWLQHPTRENVAYGWRDWFRRALDYVAGIYAPDGATRDDLTITAPRAGDFQAGRYDRERGFP